MRLSDMLRIAEDIVIRSGKVIARDAKAAVEAVAKQHEKKEEGK